MKIHAFHIPYLFLRSAPSPLTADLQFCRLDLIIYEPHTLRKTKENKYIETTTTIDFNTINNKTK